MNDVSMFTTIKHSKMKIMYFSQSTLAKSRILIFALYNSDYSFALGKVLLRFEMVYKKEDSNFWQFWYGLGYSVWFRSVQYKFMAWLLLWWYEASKFTQIATFMGPTWGPAGSCRPHLGPHVGPMNFAIGAMYLVFLGHKFNSLAPGNAAVILN